MQARSRKKKTAHQRAHKPVNKYKYMNASEFKLSSELGKVAAAARWLPSPALDKLKRLEEKRQNGLCGHRKAPECKERRLRSSSVTPLAFSRLQAQTDRIFLTVDFLILLENDCSSLLSLPSPIIEYPELAQRFRPNFFFEPKKEAPELFPLARSSFFNAEALGFRRSGSQ